MRHATPETLELIEPLLKRLRRLTQLRERSNGVFYFRSKAFLHFHEDSGDIFADVRLNPPEFDRLRVSTRAEQDDLVRLVKERLS